MPMNRLFVMVAFAIGLMTVAWVGWGFVGSSGLALVMTFLIAGVYLLGAFEIKQFRAGTSTLAAALADVRQPLSGLGAWLERVPPALRNAVRLRIEGERGGLPGPGLTPYLVGLLVMLGMLGTFLGMVVTFKGAVFALEGSTDLQAIRSALAEPIKGLGLSFGTSVAGVAASAMLGLMSALSRRERLEVARLLDTRIATVLRPFSLAHQREESLKALQAQAQTLPHLVDSLQGMMDRIERRGHQLNEQLLGQQAHFHHNAAAVYTELAASVGTSLKASLTTSARVAGEILKPVVQSAMSAIAQESERSHLRLVDTTQTQLNGLSSQFGATARTVSEGWTMALKDHVRTSDHLVDGLGHSLAAFTEAFEKRSTALLATVHEALSQSRSDQASADGHRLEAWTQTLEARAASLQAEWQRLGVQTFEQQQAVCLTLEKAAGQIAQQASHQASQTLGDIAGLLSRSEELVRSRVESEALWVTQQGDRMNELASVWRSELGALRDQEAARGNAAVERIGELQAAVALHLATLGAALEDPLTRLLQTASDVPQAAAEVIVQWRQEMARLTERDNLALEERTVVMDKMRALLETLHQSSGEQRAAIESMASSAQAALGHASQEVLETLEAHSSKASDMAVHVAGSAVELSSLGESFTHGVQLFNATSEKLMESLQRIEGAINQTLERSDEQLAYYVAQAREVIDLSITSQQVIVEDLRTLHSKQAAFSEGVV